MQAIEKAFVPDICLASRPVEFDQVTLNQVYQALLKTCTQKISGSVKLQQSHVQVVAEHLFHEGKFIVGEKFIQESGIPQGEALRKPFEAMHQVLQQVLFDLVASRHVPMHLPKARPPVLYSVCPGDTYAKRTIG